MSATEWGARAAHLYDAAYARRYRAADDALASGPLVERFGAWLQAVCRSFAGEIRVLDLGCGTGRYFRSLVQVRELVGIDVSAPMLDEARRPVAGGLAVGEIALVHGDFLTHDFAPGRFDLVYSIGVLGEHTPFDAAVAARVGRWLAPGGRFAFTAVHVSSFSVPRTLRRRVAEWLLPVAPGALGARLRQRLLAGGLYVDEAYLRDVLTGAGFDVESLDRHRSDVHLHLLCVARKQP